MELCFDVMGCATEHRIDSAVRTTTINGLDVTLVGDGQATIDSAVLSAEQIIKHHNETFMDTTMLRIFQL